MTVRRQIKNHFKQYLTIDEPLVVYCLSHEPVVGEVCVAEYTIQFSATRKVVDIKGSLFSLQHNDILHILQQENLKFENIYYTSLQSGSKLDCNRFLAVPLETKGIYLKGEHK